MESLSVPRLIVAGTCPGIGVSLVTLGIVYQLRKRNLGVSCCVCGPALAQAALLKRVSGRYVHSMDNNLLSREQSVLTFYQAGVGADVLLIEGHGGLFDGSEYGSLHGSDAELAGWCASPVIVVTEAEKLGSSVVALCKGFEELAQGYLFGGLIVNRASGSPERVEQLRHFFDISLANFEMAGVLGVIPESDLGSDMPVSQVFQKENVTLMPRQFFIELDRLIADHVDIDRILEVAHMAPPCAIADYEHRPINRRCRIAVSEDSCFSLGYQDNLALLRYFGAEIVPFSPLADQDLPLGVGAVYLSGAYLVEYGQELSGNQSMRIALQKFADQGGVVYAEGGGAAYLCQAFRPEDQDSAIPGVGLIPGVAVNDRLGFGYIEGVLIEETVLGRPGSAVKGVNSGEWKLTKAERVMRSLRMSRNGEAVTMEGFSPGAQLFCSFNFLHFGSNPYLASSLVDAAEVVRKL